MYAAILNQRVIDLTEEIRTYPPDADGNPIEVVEATEGVEIGMNYLDGLFYHQSPEVTEQEKMMQRLMQLDNIKETQLMIMEAMADQYEQGLEQDLINMEVQATIYEAVMALGGGEV